LAIHAELKFTPTIMPTFINQSQIMKVEKLSSKCRRLPFQKSGQFINVEKEVFNTKMAVKTPSPLRRVIYDIEWARKCPIKFKVTK